MLGKPDNHIQKNVIEPFLIPFTKINSIWITDLNIRPETIKLQEENKKKLLDILGSLIQGPNGGNSSPFGSNSPFGGEGISDEDFEKVLKEVKKELDKA